ncbi:Epithelial-stromal interaction protein 1, partial [Heterocephalus glaber]
STGAYTLIAPDETRRHQIQRIAEQELASLEKWKEQNRAKPIYLSPRRLGGSQSESEVRQKQQLQLMQSKYQQKSNKLEEKRLLQEKLRREALREHHQYKTAEFLSRLDRTLPHGSVHQFAPRDSQSSTWNKLPEPIQQPHEEEKAKIHQPEHKRVNNAFLDRLQGKSQPGGLQQSRGYWNTNSGNSWALVTDELEKFQDCLAWCIMHCNYKAKDSVNAEGASGETQMDSCVTQCMDDYMNLLSTMTKKMKASVSFIGK